MLIIFVLSFMAGAALTTAYLQYINKTRADKTLVYEIVVDGNAVGTEDSGGMGYLKIPWSGVISLSKKLEAADDVIETEEEL